MQVLDLIFNRAHFSQVKLFSQSHWFNYSVAQIYSEINFNRIGPHPKEKFRFKKDVT